MAAAYFDLLVRVQSGDKQAEEELWLEFRPAIENLCRCPDYEEEETDLNIFFLKLTRGMKLHKFRGADNKQIAGYIHKCLANALSDLRSHYKAPNKLPLEISANWLTNQDPFEVVAVRILAAQLLQSLTPRQRQVLLGKYDGHSNAAIAAQLGGITSQAVGGLKRRATRKLKKIYQRGLYFNSARGLDILRGFLTK